MKFLKEKKSGLPYFIGYSPVYVIIEWKKNVSLTLFKAGLKYKLLS